VEPTLLAQQDSRATGGSPIEQLYREHWDSLVRLAALVLGDQSRAEDVVADAFGALHGRERQLRTAQNLPAYLRRSVINGCRSVGRRKVLERLHLVREGSALSRRGDVPSAEDAASERASRSSMLDALADLPNRQREVLVLRYYLDLSERQIAETLGIAPGSVKAHAHRGLQVLRSRMSADSDQETP
jgi:RNA polymerase sigma-70 factor (sigma-E family)